MQTTLEIPEQELEAIDRAAAAQGITRDLFLRQAADSRIAANLSSANMLAQAHAGPEPRSEAQRLANLQQAFGLWKDQTEDGVDYQRRLRAEWDREWDPD